MVEQWNIGMMGQPNPGIMEYWNGGMMGHEKRLV
jgi:hypothetical protein